MKKLIRRLSRLANSSTYSLLRSGKPRCPHRSESFRAIASKIRRPKPFPGVPEGHVPVYVGEEMERFVVSAELLNHPMFVGLLNQSEQEYGYQQKGALRIPCHALVFERVLEALRLGEDEGDLQELVTALTSRVSDG